MLSIKQVNSNKLKHIDETPALNAHTKMFQKLQNKNENAKKNEIKRGPYSRIH